jgi:hypothetical protein
MSFETSPKVHQRRATIASVVVSPQEAAALDKLWKTELTKSRSPDARDVVRTPSPLIGLAITSGSNPNRRSRSADALHGLYQNQSPGDSRRRSAEIHYWKETKHGIPETEEGDEMPHSEKASIRDLASSTDATPADEIGEIAILKSSPQRIVRHSKSFDVSSQRAAGTLRPTEPSLPIDKVDVRLSQMEFNIGQLNRTMRTLSSNPPPSFKLQEAPKRLMSRDSTQARQLGLPSSPRDGKDGFATRSYSMRHVSSSTMRPSTSAAALPIQREETLAAFNSAPHVPSPGYAPQRDLANYPHQPPHSSVHNFSTPLPLSSMYSHSASNSTNRIPDEPDPYLPTLLDHMAPLYSALKYERTARKILEARVLQLQHDLLELTTVVAHMRGVQAYPTPSPDHVLQKVVIQSSNSTSDGESSSNGEERRYVGGAVQEEFLTPRGAGDWDGDMF